MGELPFFRAHTAFHPDRLWIWERAVYVDENQRTWLPITIEMDSSLQVLMRQEDIPLGEPVRPSQLGPYLLPLMWQLYPGRKYRGSDSSFWRIVYHIEASLGDVRACVHLFYQPCVLLCHTRVWEGMDGQRMSPTQGLLDLPAPLHPGVPWQTGTGEDLARYSFLQQLVSCAAHPGLLFFLSLSSVYLWLQGNRAYSPGPGPGL
ncbi:hypothetical protein HPG69_000073 [Diceros bicornis minor]|uniref:T-cell leukemia/lymphoma protein 1A n=1 Tax=Diceros bicornis minor TaxID=77932 RepID=A0A7J7EFT2_DICBM|nr:hypothetical protein HPG69_000073 [Diceros bicornis minor]